MSEKTTKPKFRIEEILASLDPLERVALVNHLNGGTSFEWIADTLTLHGYPISSASLRRWRKANA